MIKLVPPTWAINAASARSLSSSATLRNLSDSFLKMDSRGKEEKAMKRSKEGKERDDYVLAMMAWHLSSSQWP